VPALKAAGIEHRRIYDMRHTFATWSLAAGMSIFTLARRMGTSVQMIDSTYGHVAQDAEDQDRGLLDAYDAANESGCGHVVGTENRPTQRRRRQSRMKNPAAAGLPTDGRGGFRTCDLSRVKRTLTTLPRRLRTVFIGP